ncbi:ABC transporter substrate-binding protein [Corynebacterium sp. HMSC06D04]|uniref:iron-siderophore ABC transporter substrate-binding protein n=1 Tax=Corynebacterium TaxID=1716 RepID=UPI0008A296A4|nr:MULTISPECIES: iron-siderophore ABC transporter substrate-binding protein [unclassified Corynebacterium]OFT33766.1 ABC transporter substrate-binding protein [Corynebacterium sp. HMSC08C04]OFT51952.1 ABC transporter substrate-binding protein [Corynebacterium sp. HMSC06D04]OHO67607.1 ABC transporter substrate-binding protein [Corynebacterium sp. HMSC036D03]
MIASVAAAATLFSVTACSSEESTSNESVSSADNANSAAFPVTIEHAFSETTIEKAPERVATVGWANHEVPLALGVAPVGMSKSTWGDDNGNGIMPWTEEKLKELGAETPTLFDETDGIPFEQVADTQPDVILASYSGLTQEDYDTLSKIAPVVAYPDVPWATSMEEMVEMNAEAIGKEDEGKKLVDDLDKQTEKALSKYPDLKDKKLLFTAFGGTTDASKIGFFTTEDPRMGFLAEHGLGTPDIVEKNSKGAKQFWVEVSAEKPEEFNDVDLVVAYSSGNAADDKKALEEMQKDPLKGKIPAVKAGHVVFLDNGPLGASANQSPLSIPWGIDKYFERLNSGLQG